MSTRDVLFKLTAVNDPANRSVAKAFRDEMVAAHEDVTKAAAESTSSIVIEVKKQAEAVKASSSDVESLRYSLSQIEKERQAEAIQRFAALEARKVEIANATAQALAAAEAKYAADSGGPIPEEERTKIRVKLEAQAAKELDAIDKQLAAGRQKEAERQRRVHEQTLKAQVKDAEKAAADERRAAEASTKAIETARDKVASSNRELLQTVAELGEGVMKLGRGFVALGLIGEKDLDKVKDTLLGMQATFDLLSGSIQTFLKIQKAIEAMRNATIAAATAQELLNAAQARGSLAGTSRAVVAGAAVEGVAGAAAGAAGSRLANLTDSAVGGVAGTAAGSTAVLLGRYASAITSRATAAGLAALPVAALTAAVIGLKDLVQGGGEIRQDSTSGGILRGISRFAGGVDRFLGLDTDAARASESNEATARAERRRAELQERTAREDARIAATSSLVGRGMTAQAAGREGRLEADLEGLAAAEKIKRVTEEIRAEEESIAALKAKAAETDDRFGALREEYTAAAEQGEKRILALLGRQRDAEREAGREKVRAAEESLRISERELETAKSKAEAAQNSLLSAEERFGLLDQGEQQAILDASRRAKKGEQLSPEELRKLQGLGLDSTGALVGEQARKLAKAGGFDEIAAADRKRVEELQAAQKALEVTVEDKRQIVTNVQQDTDKIVQSIKSQILAKMAENDQALAGQVAQAMAEINDLRRIVQNGGGR